MVKGLKRDVLLAVPIGWYLAMALNRLSGHCGHLWEASYYATAIAPKDHRRVLNTLRCVHANPKAAGVRKGFATCIHSQRLLYALSKLLSTVSLSRQRSSQVPLG
jgi:hypothetical protein